MLNAAAKCAETVTPQNIAVVDPSGLLVAFLRMDNAYPGSIDLSIKKARTTVLFNGLPSGVVYDLAQPGAPFYGRLIVDLVLSITCSQSTRYPGD